MTAFVARPGATKSRFASMTGRYHVPVMDRTKQKLISYTEQRVALLRNLIEKLSARGRDVSEHRRMLQAEERYLASGCAPPPDRLEPAARRTTGISVGYIMPPGAKK
jgi:hypothetical protein